MDSGKLQLKVKRVCSRKRSRETPRSQLTPDPKRGGEDRPLRCGTTHRRTNTNSMARDPAAEVPSTSGQYCSDTEDLFGDYDSLLEDSSVLARLDAAEKNHLNAPGDLRRPGDEALDDSLLDGLESSGGLPPSQLQFQQEVQKRENRTSTPPPPAAKKNQRRSVAEQLKKALVENAAAPGGGGFGGGTVSRREALQQAVVSEELNEALKATEVLPDQITDQGPFFGLPSRVKELMTQLRGIQKLYEWQEACLNLDCVLQRKNLIFSLPTSGGKTLVAEILMLRELLCRRKDCLFILPYVSLVQEKVRGLASLGLELDFMVEEYAGSRGKFPPVKRRTKRSVYVATIEKAHSLVNSLVEGGRLQDVGLLVVDELHMLGEGHRGAIIEMTLAKVQYLSDSTQIIGMSATLGNIKDLQTFLKAEHYTNDFRPVELKEYVKLGDSIYEVDPKEENCFKFSRLLNFKYSSSMQKLDPDHLIALVTEVVPVHSCLLFCPTKRNCENVAQMICKHLREDFLQHRSEEKSFLLSQLKSGGGGSLCPVLRKTLPYGVAYHHSGLTSEERRLVEEAYSSGVLCLLACTSTLAAGINLPARRVILRSPYVAADFLKRSQYKQMVGRAGRAGIDSVGESILILQDKDREMAETLVCAPVENCYSNLMYEDGKGVLTLVLSLIGLKISRSVEELQDFLQGTLLSVQQQQLCSGVSLASVVQRSVTLLKDKQLVTEEEGQTLQVTRLGRATFKGSVDIVFSDVLYRDLSRGLEALLLNSFLHLLYLVTPYELLADCKPNWMIYFTQFTLLSPSEQKMSAAVGVPESYVARKAAGQSVKKSVSVEAVCRLYLALVLFSLLKETDVWSVAERFQLSRGFVQTLLSSSSAFCSCVLHFTEELEEFWSFRALLTELTKRLSYCVKAELIPLMEVAGVLESRARQLYNSGYKTLVHLANADPSVLCKTVDKLYRKQAVQIVASAKMLLNEKAALLQEEVDHLMTLPSDLPGVS